MDSENIRQLLHYFISDTGLTIYQIADQTGLEVHAIINFLYGGGYMNPEIAESLYGFLQEQYKLRDAAQMATLGAKLLEDAEESGYDTKVH